VSSVYLIVLGYGDSDVASLAIFVVNFGKSTFSEMASSTFSAVANWSTCPATSRLLFKGLRPITGSLAKASSTTRLAAGVGSFSVTRRTLHTTGSTNGNSFSSYLECKYVVHCA